MQDSIGVRSAGLGSNALATADAVKALFAQLAHASARPAVLVGYDSSIFVRLSIVEVVKTLFERWRWSC